MKAYRHDLDWAQEFALRSCAVMMGLFKQAVSKQFESFGETYDQPINVHHNYVSEEMIDGRPMLVTRKGAIRAGSGDLALIPGSMGTGSYVVRGLGNDASYQSASHGAGRRMSRSEARRRYTVQDVEDQMVGIEARKDASVIDDLPSAYKDIHSVIEAQGDLVEVVQHLRTIPCVKGSKLGRRPWAASRINSRGTPKRAFPAGRFGWTRRSGNRAAYIVENTVATPMRGSVANSQTGATLPSVPSESFRPNSDRVNWF